MSILVSLKFNDNVVLAADSRIMDNAGTRVLSDAEQKLFEIAPGTFDERPTRSSQIDGCNQPTCGRPA